MINSDLTQKLYLKQTKYYVDGRDQNVIQLYVISAAGGTVKLSF